MVNLETLRFSGQPVVDEGKIGCAYFCPLNNGVVCVRLFRLTDVSILGDHLRIHVNSNAAIPSPVYLLS